MTNGKQTTLLLLSAFLHSVLFSQRVFSKVRIQRSSGEFTNDRQPHFVFRIHRIILTGSDQENITIKYSTADWLFVTATPLWIQTAKKTGIISDFYFEIAPPKLLADTARVTHSCK